MSALVTLASSSIHAASLGNGFTYRGRLDSGGTPATGLFDLTFTLHDHRTNVAIVGTYVLLTAVPVTNGLFTVRINSNSEFGPTAFNGDARWLEIGVRPNGVFGNFTFLSPRLSLDVTPYAAFAVNAASANSVPTGAITSAMIAPGTMDAGLRYTPSNNSWVPMSASPATGEPSERHHATAVWTGNEVIVWGGESSGIRLRTGGSYRPGIRWTNLPSAGAPCARNDHTAIWTGTDARRRHSAIWTGTEMIVWGEIGFASPATT